MEVRAGCADRFFSLSFDSSPMFGDRRRTVRLCAPARCVCVCVREEELWRAVRYSHCCVCVGSRIQIHLLHILDQLLFTLETFKQFIESETK